MEIEDGKIRVHFNHTEGGLVPKGGETLRGFAIAGPNRQFEWAQAKIEEDTVLVWSLKIPTPLAVRYGWDDAPICNLFNGAGLPASPFRTDDWPDAVREMR